MPMRVGSVGLKPNKKVPLKEWRVDDSAVSWSSVTATPNAPDSTRGCRLRVTRLMDDSLRESSRHRKSLDTARIGSFNLPGTRAAL
ncbi:hypothetical protein EVAR_26570_1 [Eumeta japonica]|uniref:Uncharacterized protein n=1 Tax=Eumeta variegata TaxID=151549 RepID=A0A4C1W7L0_EUMVA|nr:hypothetical protein EVAR_26570_1 [Eumeta japonica]